MEAAKDARTAVSEAAKAVEEAAAAAADASDAQGSDRVRKMWEDVQPRMGPAQ